MSAPELKPCPFCGGDMFESWGASTWSLPVMWIYCTECNATGPRIMAGRNEEIELWEQRVKDAWNTRADLPPTLEKALALPEVQALVEAAEDAEYDLLLWLECSASLVEHGFCVSDTQKVAAKLTAALRALKGGTE